MPNQGKNDLLEEAVLSVDSDAEAVRTLLESGADVNAADAEGHTPLHWAAMADWCEDGDGRTELLIRAGANLEARVNTEAHRGWTPLMYAAAEGHSAQVKALIDAGADINASDASGMTPLMLAVSQSWEVEKKVRLLMQSGADVGKRCNSGLNAIDYLVDYINISRSFSTEDEIRECEAALLLLTENGR